MGNGIDLSFPVARNLVSAFLAMESTDYLVKLARELGGGSITVEVQSFILRHCINNSMMKGHTSTILYLRNFLKKVVLTAESCGAEVLDEIYEHFMLYMNSFKEGAYFESKAKVCRCISFILPDGYHGSTLPSMPTKLLVPLWCSPNMLEGDTGTRRASHVFSTIVIRGKSIKVGSGVGLVGLCLVQAKASKVILSDGDFSTLSNMKRNLEVNHVNISNGSEEKNCNDHNKVECLYLPWESASDSALQGLNAEIILGADVIYDPLCIPHLVHILHVLLNPQTRSYQKSFYVHDENRRDRLITDKNDEHDNTLNRCTDLSDGLNEGKLQICGKDATDPYGDDGVDANHLKFPSDETNSLNRPNAAQCCGESEKESEGCEFGPNSANGLDAKFVHENGAEVNDIGEKKPLPVAYFAAVIRNEETFDHFLAQARQAQLCVVDITALKPPLNFLPYMNSYDRSSVHLLKICYPAQSLDISKCRITAAKEYRNRDGI